jgi:hypothetical protein
MDPVSLATAAVLLVAKTAANALGTQLGTTVADGIGHLGDLLRRRFAGDQDAEGALTAVEQAPSDTPRLEHLQGVVQGYATQDPTFADELRQIVAQAQAAGVLPPQTVIQAQTIKALFQGSVHVTGGFTIN